MELINSLVSSLGISEDQGKGGAGMLFNLAKEKLESGEFQQIADKILGLSDIMSAALAEDGGGAWELWVGLPHRWVAKPKGLER